MSEKFINIGNKNFTNVDKIKHIIAADADKVCRFLKKHNLDRASMQVISVLEDSDGQVSYTACVTYVYDGKLYRDKGWKGMSKGEYGIGRKVDILINPDKPNMPYIYSGNISGHLGGSIFF